MIYWLTWGGLFPWLIIGQDRIRRIVRPQKLNTRIVLLVLFPLVMAGLYRILAGMEYDKPSLWILPLLLSTNVGNGFLEELLWRGVYGELFPDSIPLRIIWPSIWFALWRYVPGSVAPDGQVLGLMIGSGLMDF